jgi:hypothetical protein
MVRRAEEGEEGGKGGAARRRRAAKPEIDAEVRKSLRAAVFLPHDVITAVAHGRQPVVYLTWDPSFIQLWGEFRLHLSR